jgi:hypothetical protein
MFVATMSMVVVSPARIDPDDSELRERVESARAGAAGVRTASAVAMNRSDSVAARARCVRRTAKARRPGMGIVVFTAVRFLLR